MVDKIFKPCPSCGAIGVVNERCEFCGNTILGEEDPELNYTERVVRHATISPNKFAEKIAKFDKVGDFISDCAVVNIGSLFGIINLNGDLIVPLRYSKIGLSKGFACLFQEKSIELIDINEWTKYNIPINGDIEFFKKICPNVLLLIDNTHDEGLLFDCGKKEIISKHIKEFKPTKKGYYYRTIQPGLLCYYDIRNHAQYSWNERVIINTEDKKGKENNLFFYKVSLLYENESLILSIEKVANLNMKHFDSVMGRQTEIIDENKDVKSQIDSYINQIPNLPFNSSGGKGKGKIIPIIIIVVLGLLMLFRSFS